MRAENRSGAREIVDRDQSKICRNNRLTDRICTSGAIACAVLLTVSASAFDTARHDLAKARQSRFLETGDAGARSGVGIGQLSCGDFNESAQRLESGQNDGLYFAFLSWRDGFVTATTDHGWQLPFVSDRGEEWLRTYCDHYPQERFAHAVVKFVFRLKNYRMAQR